ncbi:response regulator [Arhodomonas sp. SL1]|uniref:response regulator n=1 Tax=Arhodomonas sp. SL1 TaxID=3425691 RepID=UPI003F88077C
MSEQSIGTALVVDDSRLARVALTRLLRRHEIDVDEAATGGEALAYIRDRVPDVVFMDYMMPDMDGFEATRQLHEYPGAGDVPVVMYTSQDSDDDRSRAKSLGVVDFLIKPSGEDGLERVLESVQAYRAEAGAAEIPAEAFATEADVASGTATLGPQAAAPAQPAPMEEEALRRLVAAESERAARDAVTAVLGEEPEARIRAAVEAALEPVQARVTALEEAPGPGPGEAPEVPDTAALAGEVSREAADRVVDEAVPRVAERASAEALGRIEQAVDTRLEDEELLSTLSDRLAGRLAPMVEERVSGSLRDTLRRELLDEASRIAHEQAVEAVDGRAAGQGDAVENLIAERVSRESAALRRMVVGVAVATALGLVAVAALSLL